MIKHLETYDEVVSYILDIPRFTVKTELDNTRKILAALGNPEQKAKTIHIAGTNGKGSVARMLSDILINGHHKTGLFTSPHLQRINERISINGREIPDADMVHLFDTIMNTLEELTDVQHPSFFEFMFIMAALYFAENGCEYVVYETGLGGRLDATNVITPVVSVITSIGMDHMQYLGDTIESIAGEKAGILKPGVPVVINTGSPEASEVIKARARELGCAVFDLAEEDDASLILGDRVREFIENYPVIYQRDNARTAIKARLVMLTVLSEDPSHPPMYVQEYDHISRALDEFYWPGRMEYLAPNVIIDGAHNEDAIKRCIETVQYICKNDGWEKVSLLFGVSGDKDYDTIIRLLCEGLSEKPGLEDIYITEAASSRAEKVARVMEVFQKYLPSEKHYDVNGSSNMDRMLSLAVGELDDKTLLLIVGSLYMVADIKKLVRKKY